MPEMIRPSTSIPDLNLERESRQRILRDRAALLAADLEDEASTSQFVDVLRFCLSGETFAIDSEFIREVLPLKEITRLPCTPAFVLGIINVRGQILSVIDIKRFFDLTHQGLSNLNKLIIVSTDEVEVGILADSIVGIHSLLPEALQQPSALLAGSGAMYLRGVTAERLLVLDLNRLLGDSRIVVDEEVNVRN